MNDLIDFSILWSLARRTFSQYMKSPVAYVVAIFFYGFLGAIFGGNFFVTNQASIDGVGQLAPWVLWFVVPALTMSLLSEELRLGTFESLATLPVRDSEIVLGKFLGFALLALVLVGGLLFYPILISFVTLNRNGIDWGGTFGILAALYGLILFYGAMGLFASSLARNQVVALIIGMIFCTIFFMIGLFFTLFPGFLGMFADFLGVNSHVTSLSRGVIDIRDVFYFASMSTIFLYLTIQKLTTRRF